MTKLKQILYSKPFEILYLFSSAFMVGLLIYVLYYAFVAWQNVFSLLTDIPSQMFYLALGICIVTVLGRWIEGRIKAIIESWEKLKGGRGNGKGRLRRN